MFSTPNLDASNLIRKLLCVQPNKRATIIDICTDPWVNKDCERCLLQVAEDLANLTPVKIEILLALAPIPQSNSQTSIEQKKSNYDPNKITVLEPNDEQSVKRRKSTKKSADGKKSKDKENDSKSSKIKTLKEENLDENKKSVKSSQQSKNSLNQDSDYVSEEPISLSRKSDIDKGSRSIINQSITDLSDAANKPSSTNKFDQTGNSVITRKPSVKSTVQKISNKTDDKLKKDDQSKEASLNKSNKPEIKEEQNSTSSINLVRKPSTKTRTVSTKTTIPTSSNLTTNKDNKEKDKDKDKDNKETIVKDISKDSTVKGINKESIKDANKTKKVLSTQQSIEITKETQADDQSNKEQTPIRTQSKIGDAKRMFEKPRRQESIEREKQERIIFLNKVSDVKNKFERRASVNAASASLWSKPSLSLDADRIKKKMSLTDNSINASVINTLNNNSEQVNKSPVAKVHTNTVNDSHSKTIDSNNLEISKESSKVAPKEISANTVDKKEKAEKTVEQQQPITTTTSISTIKPKLIERQISASSSSNNPPTGNDRSNLKVRRHTVKAKTSSSTANVPTIAELKRKTDLLPTTKEKPIIETIKETEVSTHPPLSPTKTSSLFNSNNSSNSSISKSTIIEQPLQVTSTKRSTPPPYSNTSTNAITQSSPIRSPTPISTQNNTNDNDTLAQQITTSNSMEIRPKLKIISNTNQTEASTKSLNNNNQSSSSMSQNSSIKPTNSQESFNNNSMSSLNIQAKLAPITRSYKKISFTKDGQAITETGRIISEESPTGTKITKKIITKKSNSPSDNLYESRTNQSLDSETDEYTSTMNDRLKSKASALNNHSNSSYASSSTIRKSDSTSSSESVDIFDMDFDQWIGDSMFNNISSKFKSLFNQTPGLVNSSSGFGRKSNSPFPSFLNRSKPSLSKRAESCERKYNNDENQMNMSTGSGLGLRRRQGYSTEGESDTDNEDSMQNIGLWKLGKFLNPNVTTRFLNKNSLMNGMDFFNDDNQSNLLNRSRERLKFDSKPPTAGLSSRFKSASRDLGEPNDQVFKTTFTIRPNSAAKIVTTTSRNNSGSNLANNQNMQMSNSMTNSMPSRTFERMNSDQLYEFEPDMNTDFKTNFPMTIGRIRNSNSQSSQPLSPQVQNTSLSQFSSPRILNRSISSKPSSNNNSRSFMDTGNYRGLNIGRVHEIPIEIQQQQDTNNTPMNSNNGNNTQKEYYIPITRQGSNSQFEQENNSNTLLDQLRTHGYRSLVNQRNSKLSNNMNMPITNEDEQMNSKNGQNIQIINKNTNKRGKNELDDELQLKSKLTNNDQSMSKIYKNLISTKESDLNLNELVPIKSKNINMKDYKVCSNQLQTNLNQHHNLLNNKNHNTTKTNQLDKQFDYKGLTNVARELNYFSDLKSNLSSVNKLTKKYSVSSKSLEHLNTINLTNSTKKPSRLFNVYTSTAETIENKPNENGQQDKDSSDEDKTKNFTTNGLKTSINKPDRLNERKQDSKLDLELNEKNLKQIPAVQKSRRRSIDEDTTLESSILDESIMHQSSTSSMLQLLNDDKNYNDNKSIDDLKDDYLNCSINNQVDQIQQLIRLLYEENDNIDEEDADKLGRPSSKKSNQFKQDNYQLLRKTSKGLKELKNNLQILQLKNKLKRRFAEERCIQSKNELKKCLENSTRDYSLSTDASATTTVTPTSDEEDDDLLGYRRKASFKSLPPLPPQSSINNNSNDRLMNDNLIKSNKRMTDVNCLTKNNLTNQSKFNDNQKNYLPSFHNQIPNNSLSNSSYNLLNKEHGMCVKEKSFGMSNSSIVSNRDQKIKNQSKHIFSPSTRSSATLNGHLNGNQLATSSSSSSSDLVKHHNSLYSALDTQSDGSTRELHRRSTIGNGSSKETMQERILRKSYYTRFNSPDRTNLDNQNNRMRRKSALTDYMNNFDDYLSESNSNKNRSQRSKSITRSISSLNNREEDDNCSISSSIAKEDDKNLNKRTSLNRTSHSPYRSNNMQNVQNDLDDELSDEELLKSLSSVNRRNSFAYGSSTAINRYPTTSLQASFERNLSKKQKSTFNTNDDLNDSMDIKKDSYVNNVSRLKRNSIAQISDYNNNSNLFRSSLSSLRTKLNESNGLLDDNMFKNDLSSNQLNRIRKSIELST